MGNKGCVNRLDDAGGAADRYRGIRLHNGPVPYADRIGKPASFAHLERLRLLRG